LWGAGALVAGLVTAGWSNVSPEAQLARAAHEAVRGNEVAALSACASGRELVDRGYQRDVSIAAAVNVSTAVPYLKGRQFRNSGGS
jgi:2-phosphosulfolactate phosphatase